MCLATPLVKANEAFPLTKARSRHYSLDEGHHIIVQHDYKDHANDTPPVLDNILEILVNATSPSPNASFPYKLYDMLQRVEQDGNAHIVSFQPHGRCMVIHKPELMTGLLPTYFQLSKLPSFQRQLNLYGFRRLTKGPDRGGYYHEYFLRSKPHLISKIQRMKVKGTGVRARSNPEQEPDFWSMPWVGVANTTTTLTAIKTAEPCVSSESAATTFSESPAGSVAVVAAVSPSSSSTIVSSYDETDHEDSETEGLDDDMLEDDVGFQCDVPNHQTFEFAQPCEYRDDMELCAWGKTFHYMEDIHVTSESDNTLPPNQVVSRDQQEEPLLDVLKEVDSFFSAEAK